MNFIVRISIKVIIKILLYLIVASVVFGFISQFTISLLNIDINYPSLKNHIHKNGIYYSIFSYAIITPLLEELSFRLWLKYSKINIAISLFSTILLLIKVDSSLHICLLLLAILLFIVLIIEFTKFKLSFIWDKYQKIIFLFSCFLFGISHIYNFKINNTILLLSPIITLQQISMGIILAKTRIKNGVIYSILPHSLYNSIIILVEFI